MEQKLKFRIHKEKFREDHYKSEQVLSISCNVPTMMFKFFVDAEKDNNIRLANAEFVEDT